MAVQLLCGDARAVLATLPAGSVQTCITSPPYFGLRSYLPADHAEKLLEIGIEDTPEAYVARLVAVFAEVRRVLVKDGTLWVCIGDSYSIQHVGRRDHGTGVFTSHLGPQRDGIPGGTEIPASANRLIQGLKPKDLIGIPWRLAFALQTDGWYLRQDIIWQKPNAMPESVTDRPTKSHEYIFLLAKEEHYYYDAAAIAEPSVSDHGSGNGYKRTSRLSYSDANGARGQDAPWTPQATRNKRSVWNVNTQSYSGAHFATFPEALVQPCILAGSRPGDMVLDCFAGSGTVGAVALAHGRDFIGIDLNPAYIELSRQRLGLFATQAAVG